MSTAPNTQTAVYLAEARRYRGTMRMRKLWGERCAEDEGTCFCCAAWRCFDRTGRMPTSAMVGREAKRYEGTALVNGGGVVLLDVSTLPKPRYVIEACHYCGSTEGLVRNSDGWLECHACFGI